MTKFIPLIVTAVISILGTFFVTETRDACESLPDVVVTAPATVQTTVTPE